MISMPPPSSGGTALIEMLNILEALEIQKKPRGSPEALHLVAEAMRRVVSSTARVSSAILISSRCRSRG